MAEKPLILISNDDGITSKGIRILVELMQELGEVIVVAPNSPQSGMGHAITIGETLRVYTTEIFPGVLAYECSGTPADCIKLAKHHLLGDRTPDLVVSGINHGSNTSINVLYSGTMSAAIEAAVEGLPSIGFSVCDYDHEAEMEHLARCKSHPSQLIVWGNRKFLLGELEFEVSPSSTRSAPHFALTSLGGGQHTVVSATTIESQNPESWVITSAPNTIHAISHANYSI